MPLREHHELRRKASKVIRSVNMKEGNIRRDEILRKQNKTGINPTHGEVKRAAP